MQLKILDDGNLWVAENYYILSSTIAADYGHDVDRYLNRVKEVQIVHRVGALELNKTETIDYLDAGEQLVLGSAEETEEFQIETLLRKRSKKYKDFERVTHLASGGEAIIYTLEKKGVEELGISYRSC